jgi:DHA3 family tetracycline resistance protein-like MFS transporter
VSIDVTERIRAARALRSRPFALLWSGQTISALGDGAYTPALALQTLALTHSSAALAAIIAATIVPRLIFLLVGGLVADRLPRRAVLFVSDTGRALAVGGIAVLSWSGALHLWHLIVLGAIFGVVGAFFLPAYRAMPPLLVPREALPSANALTELSGQLGLLIGPLIGAGLVFVTGPAAAFAFDSASFVIAAASLLAIRLPRQQAALQREIVENAHTQQRGGVRRAGRELREAAAFILASIWLTTTIVIPAFGNAAFGGAMVVTLPKLITEVYGGGAWLLGAVIASVAFGRISAAFMVGQLRLRHRGIIAFAADIVAAMALLAFALPLPPHLLPFLGLAAGFVFGTGGGTFQTIWVTLLHELTPSEILGRVASIDLLGSFCLQPLGFLLAGLVADSLGPIWVFLGAGLLNLALYAFPLFLPGIQEVN